MNLKFFKRAVQCLDATVGIVSNNQELIRDKRFFESPKMESLLTNVHKLPEVPYENIDAEFIVVDDPHVRPSISIGSKTCFCAGDFTRMEKECADIRYSLFGNLGLFFRYTLAVLERYHGIHSFHASSMYIPSNNTLLLVIGEAGAGKTVYLLEGVVHDWKIFSTEMTHLRVTENGYEFYKGSLYDNVRAGNLVYDFPEAAKKLKITIPKMDNIWGNKVTIDLGSLQADDVYKNPKVQIVSVRIESNRTEADVSIIKNKDKIVWTLFKNASEKLAPPWLMYERVPVSSCDDENLSGARLEDLQKFIETGDILPVKSIFAGVKNCLEGIEM